MIPQLIPLFQQVVPLFLQFHVLAEDLLVLHVGSVALAGRSILPTARMLESLERFPIGELFLFFWGKGIPLG